MKEIDKLRKRLSNVGRNVTEYRMTVAEARNLVKEFEELEVALSQKPKEIIITKEPEIQPVRVLDGGTF